MKVHRKIGSKERFVEMFQNVNKMQINENFGDLNEANTVLNKKFDELKKDELTITNTNTQVEEGVSYVELNCVDNENNKVVFNFKAVMNEEGQDGVFSVEGVDLHSFSFLSSDGNETLNMEKDSLKNFNHEYKGEFFDLIDKHINVEDKLGTLDDDMNEEEKNKKISDPYGGSSNELQTGKAFADEKPTNDNLRVKSPELDKFIDEGVGNDKYDGNLEEIKNEISQLQSKMETGGTPKMFERDGLLYVSAEDGEYFADYYGEISDGNPHIDERLEAIADKYDTYWDWENAGSIVLSPIYDMEEGKDNPIGDEVETGNIEQINKEKEEVGDTIHGGLADENLPTEFDKDQILMGMKVEMEHTDDPMVAVEITMDHLKENPTYYTHLEKMEDNMEMDSEKSEDEIESDVLLGYQPLNVGDEIK